MTIFNSKKQLCVVLCALMYGDVHASMQFEYNQPSGQTGKPTNIAVGEMPLSGNLIVTTRFGMGRTNSDGSARTHAGLDIVNTNGDHKLYAIADGTVIANDWLNGGGNFIRIRRKDNNDVYQYLHLANRSPINVGTEVKKGNLLVRWGTRVYLVVLIYILTMLSLKKKVPEHVTHG
jgi:murein DD-endopeptidase MepM/ murein hydrolase activator NlpD